MCAWIDETQQMNVLRCRFGCAMFKCKRDVCTSVVPKGYLSFGGILGGVSKPAPYGWTRWKSSARRTCSPMGTKGAGRKILSILHIILKPNKNEYWDRAGGGGNISYDW